MADEPLKLKFLGSLIEQLGAQLYPSATATIAELISNAWDADARNVWVEIPLGQRWKPSDKIVVVDDGTGMSRADAASRYLRVGRKRRVELGKDKTQGDRPLHGRKGIGKLAAFGTAKILECYTVSAYGESTSFRLDYDSIRALDPSSDYEVETAQDQSPLTAPDGSSIDRGTRITLKELKSKRAINESQFLRSMSRRFALDTTEMAIHINGEEMKRFDYPVEFRFPRDGRPEGEEITVANGWAEEDIEQGRKVIWWIGFTEKPLSDQSLQGISILARGKMVQNPFLFQRSQGVGGQLGQEYLVGEVQADWLDEGADIDQDRIQANRDQLQTEDADLDEFMRWGRKRLAWALGERNRLRVNRVADHLDIDSFKDLIDQLTPEERNRMRRVVLAVSRIPEIGVDEARSLVQSIVDAHSDTIVRGMLENIDADDPEFQTKIWSVVGQFGLIDARRNQSMIEARLKAITELERFVRGGALEVPSIHAHIKTNPWLLDPRWDLLDDEVHLSDLGIKTDEGYPDKRRMDFLFALGPSSPYTHDQLLIVEIKRGTDSSGKDHVVSADEISRFQRYVLAAYHSERKATKPLRVTGLMIAQDYTEEADRVKQDLESGGQVHYVFNTWYGVLRETKRLHEGWLAVTSRRATAREEEI